MARALVTGAGARLGRAIALELAEQGYAVAVHYAHSADAAHGVVHEIAAAGGQAVAMQCDFVQPNAADGLIGRVTSELGGPLDILVNNASIFEEDRLQNITDSSWNRAFETNLHMPTILTRDFANQVGESGANSLVVNMIDQRAHHPSPDFFSYTLAKTALQTFTYMAAQALAPHIRVNGIAPGPTLQSIHQSTADFDAERQNTPLKKGASTKDIVSALRYLLSAPAVTGQILYVDGGQHLKK